jgi:hypothetical protein
LIVINPIKRNGQKREENKITVKISYLLKSLTGIDLEKFINNKATRIDP